MALAVPEPLTRDGRQNHQRSLARPRLRDGRVSQTPTKGRLKPPNRQGGDKQCPHPFLMIV